LGAVIPKYPFTSAKIEEGVKDKDSTIGIISNTLAFGCNLAIGLNLAIGHNLAIGLNLARRAPNSLMV